MIKGEKSALRIRLTVVFLLVLALALGTMWANMIIRKTAFDDASQTQRTDPDFFVEDFRYYKMKPTGETQYKTTGSKMTHYPVADSYLIENPQLLSLNQYSQLQTISSKEAYVEDFNSKVHMRNNVIMEREPSSAKGFFRLNSEYLLIYPNEEIMTSDQKVTIKDENTVISGIGMHANNGTRELHIQSRAKVTYLPPGTVRK